MKAEIPIEFRLCKPPGCKVAVAGTFNDWNPMSAPLQDESGNGHFRAIVRVPPGRHEYRFIVDGKWHIDPNCAVSVRTGYGSVNSILLVPAET
ncbi:MAG: glycogen-binding domain-containing protein [bacterium]